MSHAVPKSDIGAALEAGKELSVQAAECMVEKEVEHKNSAEEMIVVSWDGDDDPWHPFNWPLWKRVWMLLFTSFGSLVCLMSGSMLAPALGDISRDLGLDAASAEISLSIYVLAFSFGPLVLAPLAELYGRRPIWLAGAACYAIWNLVCGFTSNRALMIMARFLAGCGASVEFAIGSPVNADTWRPEQRGQAFAITTFLPLLGPALGPIISGFIVESVGWRWLFYTMSCFEALIILVGFFTFFETSASHVLQKKARALTSQTGRPHRTCSENDDQTLWQKLSHALSRPFRMLATQPTIMVMSILIGYNFGMIYIMLTSFITIFTSIYHESEAIAGLHYLAIAIGYTFAAQVGGRATDAIYRRLKHRAGGAAAPEYRVPLMAPGAVLVPIGFLWCGWAAQSRAHWVMVDFGAGVFGCGVILSGQAMAAYVMDAYQSHVGSATAATQFLRNIAGFAFPIFAPSMYTKLGYGWGNTLIAAVYCVLMIPAPLLLWKYGSRLRQMREWKG